jgi:type IV secretory pathway VirB10-like protein
MLRIRYAVLGLMLIAFAGCGKESGDNGEPETPAAAEESAHQAAPPEISQEQAEAPAASSRPARAPATTQPARTEQRPARSSREPAPEVDRPEEPAAPVSRAEEAAPAAERAERAPEIREVKEPKIVTVAGGTAIQVRLQEGLDSSVNKTGETFEAILDEDIEVNGLVVAPRGSIVEGTLTNVAQSGRVEGRAKMSLRLDNLVVGNESYPFRSETLSFEAESTKKGDAAKVGLGAGI